MAIRQDKPKRVPLQHTAKRINGPSAFLARMFAKVFHERGVQAIHWDRLLDDYVNDPINYPTIVDRSKKVSDKNNLIKELLASGMSFKNLIKGFKVLKLWKVRIIFECTDLHGVTTVHMDEMVLRRNPNEKNDSQGSS
jgi:hypothetical protein